MNKIVNGVIVALTTEEVAQRESDATVAQSEQAIQAIKWCL